MATLIVHGGAGAPPLHERPERQAAVERALEAGWERMSAGPLEAVLAAVRLMEDHPLLNAGIGAALNLDGVAELDAGLMEGTELRVGSVGAITDVRHPIDLAREVMEDGRHVLLVGTGASRFARARGLETCDPSLFVTERQLRRLHQGGDTVGAVASDDHGRTAVAVSTGGVYEKVPGRVGDSPIPGAGFYADDHLGVACGTGIGEVFMRLCLCFRVVQAMAEEGAEEAVRRALAWLEERTGGEGGLIAIDAAGQVGVAWNTPFMSWARRTG